MTPVFIIFDLIGSLFYASSQSDWHPLSAEKSSLSLLHLVPEILGPKVVLISTKMFCLTVFKHFDINFLLDFRSSWPPFPWILDLFDSSCLQNLISDWDQFLITCWTQLPKIWWWCWAYVAFLYSESPYLYLCIPRGMVTAILFLVDQVMCDWLNHTTWFHSNRALPRSMEFDSMLLHFFYTIQMPICSVGCLMLANTWIYISLYLRNTAILENKKSVCIFLHQLVNTCDLHIRTS